MYVNVSSPVNPGLGIYVIVPLGLTVTAPFVGLVVPVIEIGSASGSKSLTSTAISIGVATGVVAVSALAIGASFSGPLSGNTSI